MLVVIADLCCLQDDSELEHFRPTRNKNMVMTLEVEISICELLASFFFLP